MCRFAILLSVVLTVIGGCSAIHRTSLPLLPDNVPASYELDAVPFYPQDDYQCGPATLAMALTWRGMKITPDELKNQVYSPSRKGSLQLAMVGATRRHGKLACEIHSPDSIFAEIAAGHPVIILQNLGLSWLPGWHYAVVIGYDRDKGTVILRSGRTRRKLMSYYLFEKTWAYSDYWGLMVLDPSQIPVLAKENNYLQAVLGLEKSRHYDDAVKFAKQVMHGGSELEQPNQVGALAVMIAASAWDSYWDQTEQYLNQLRELKTETDTECLLKAYALATTDPDEALATLETTPRGRHSPVGLFVRGQARLLIGIDRQDAGWIDDALRVFESVQFLFRDYQGVIKHCQ